MNTNKIVSSIVGGGLALSMMAGISFAASTVVVTPSNTQGWSTADTRTGGSVTYVPDANSPSGQDALELTTDATTTSKAQYIKAENVPLSSVSALSYYTKNVSGPEYADPSYQLLVDLNGSADGGFTTFVYEPYQNGTVVPGTWQSWDVDAGQFWSSRSFTDGTCSVTAGGGGAPFYTLAGLQSACPSAVVVGFGVNIGSNNPNYVVRTDLVSFNTTAYDFELVDEPTVTPTPSINLPTSKDACKNNGYKNFTDTNGQVFKNQGQCVSYFNHQ